MPKRLPPFLTSPYTLLVLNMLFWSGNWIISRALRHEVTPIGLNFWRWTLALAILLPFTWREVWEHRRVVVRDWKVILALGALSISVFNLLVYQAMRGTTVANGVLISSLQPIGVIFFAWLLAGERPSGRQALGAVISLAGMMVIVTRGEPLNLLEVRFNPGDLWTLGMLPVWGVYSVLLRYRPPELSPQALLAVMTFFGVLLLLPFAIHAHFTGTPIRLDPATVGALFYLAIFASLLGMVFYNIGVAELGPNMTGMFLHLVPVFGIAQAWIFLGEPVRLYHLSAAALIFSGLALAVKYNLRPRPHASALSRPNPPVGRSDPS